MKADLRSVLKAHVNTERTTVLRELNNEYVFFVDRRASKPQVRMAVEQAFGVKVEAVRTSILPGKTKRVGRNEGKRPTRKKAIVRLKKGESITLFENV
jgi:large subunit ribosomal protein L23